MTRSNVWGLWAGVALIGLGVLFMLGQFLQINVMRYLWPVFILAVGAAFFIGMLAGGRATGALAVPGSVITTIGLILFFQNLFGLWASWTYAWALIIAGAGLGLVIFGQHSYLPDLRRVGQVVIVVGLGLFFVFGLFFELGASLLGMRSPGGAIWAILLILVGVYVLLSRTALRRWTDTGPVDQSFFTFQNPDNVIESSSSTSSTEFVASPEAVTGVQRVRFRSLGDMTILQGEREGLEIEASQIVRERIRVEVRGDMLEIYYQHNWLDWLQPRFWNFSSPLRYTLYLHNLKWLDAAGLGNLMIPSLNTSRLDLMHSGAGNVTIRRLLTSELLVNQAGLGNIEIEGRADRQEVELSGAGSYHAGRLESSVASINLSGLGSASIWVQESLDARISGAGSVDYYGNPKVSQHVSGLGSVRRQGAR